MDGCKKEKGREGREGRSWHISLFHYISLFFSLFLSFSLFPLPLTISVRMCGLGSLSREAIVLVVGVALVEGSFPVVRLRHASRAHLPDMTGIDLPRHQLVVPPLLLDQVRATGRRRIGGPS